MGQHKAKILRGDTICTADELKKTSPIKPVHRISKRASERLMEQWIRSEVFKAHRILVSNGTIRDEY